MANDLGRPLWREFKHRNLVPVEGLMVLAAQGKPFYVGIPVEITDKYIILVNGSDSHVMWYNSMPGYRFTLLPPPGGISFGVGEHRLPFQD